MTQSLAADIVATVQRGFARAREARRALGSLDELMRRLEEAKRMVVRPRPPPPAEPRGSTSEAGPPHIPSTMCPSARPEWKRSAAIGVVMGTATEPRVEFFREPLPVTPELLKTAKPFFPEEVLRFAAPCHERRCVHFEAGSRRGTCHLVERVVDLLEPVSSALPACNIRPSCRWWLQERSAACSRCTQLVTKDLNPSIKRMRVNLPILHD
jgi:hypothetical protein